MNSRRFARPLVLSFTLVALLFSLTVVLTGCGDDAGDYDIMEEPEITVEYLTGEFAQQLLRDGGEQMMGTIHLDPVDADNGKYQLTVNSMIIVESSITDEGYYIADKNLSQTVPLDIEARATYIRDRKTGPEVMNLIDFIKQVQADGDDVLNAGEEKLYQVYTIDGNALLILAQELPET